MRITVLRTSTRPSAGDPNTFATFESRQKGGYARAAKLREQRELVEQIKLERERRQLAREFDALRLAFEQQRDAFQSRRDVIDAQLAELDVYLASRAQ